MTLAPVKELARRSDILITSTISMSVFPVDKRTITQQKRALMQYDDVTNMVDEKYAF